MTESGLTVQRSGYAHIQDLGRPGYAAIGVSGNGAGDQGSARLANALVGNRDAAPLIEVVASAFEFVTRGDLLLAVCGAVEHIVIDGYHWPTHQPVAVPSGARVVIPEPGVASRSYLALNGVIEAEQALGSVAPDPLLGFGRQLPAGSQITVATGFRAADVFPLSVFRVATIRQRFGTMVSLHATRGPDLDRLAGGAAALDATFEVTPQSDYIGVRLTGGDLSLAVRDEILSRGVPVGAVEVPPSGELIMLLRGRLVTAGYPVVAVLTRPSIDRLAQARPGDQVTLSLVDLDTAGQEIDAGEAAHLQAAVRVAAALTARGLGRLVDEQHASRG